MSDWAARLKTAERIAQRVTTWALAIALGVCTVAAIPIIHHIREHRANGKAFSRVRLGMEKAEALALVGRPPDCVTHIKHSEALCWFAGAMHEKCRDRITHIGALSFCGYASLQLLVGPGGKIMAVGLEGETSGVPTVQGEMWGSALQHLPNEFVQ